MSIGALTLSEAALGAQQLTRSKSTKAPSRRQFVVKSDAVVTPEPR